MRGIFTTIGIVTFAILFMAQVSFSECEGDLNCDGDTDGIDLAVFAADFGATGCPTTCLEIPLIITDSVSHGIIQAENTNSNGYGLFGEASGLYGTGVYGYASNTGNIENTGGYFESAGGKGKGVEGIASLGGNYINYGGYFEAAGAQARAVYGYAGDSGSLVNYGGYFRTEGAQGRAVYGNCPGLYGIGIFGETAGQNSKAVFGKAGFPSGYGIHYGGYFEALGPDGRGVFGSGLYGVIGVGAAGGYDFYAEGPGENYGSASSIRWKENILEIDNALEKVLALRGVYFDWDKEHGSQHDMGFIAEEVGEQIPEIVSYEKDSEYATGMDYGAITPVLLQAIKEQQGIIQNQQMMIEDQQIMINELIEKVSQIEIQLAK